MPRPTTKAGILSESAKEHDALEQLLATLTPEQMVHPGIVGEWSVKDVLAHLTEWQQMVLGWYHAGLAGEIAIAPRARLQVERASRPQPGHLRKVSRPVAGRRAGCLRRLLSPDHGLGGKPKRGRFVHAWPLCLGKVQCPGILRHLVHQQPRSLGQNRAAQRPTRQQRMMVRQ